MPYNQLFKIAPDIQIIQSILDAFGLDDIEDVRFFTKDHMTDIGTIEKIYALRNQLKNYYLPCKFNKYTNDLNEKRCITILRQFIKSHEYKCIGLEKSIQGKKTMIYRLLYTNDSYLESPKPKKEASYVLSFE
jgi:hypothetical protein